MIDWLADWLEGCLAGWKHGWLIGYLNGRMDVWLSGSMDGWLDICVCVITKDFHSVYLCAINLHRTALKLLHSSLNFSRQIF